MNAYAERHPQPPALGRSVLASLFPQNPFHWIARLFVIYGAVGILVSAGVAGLILIPGSSLVKILAKPEVRAPVEPAAMQAPKVDHQQQPWRKPECPPTCGQPATSNLIVDSGNWSGSVEGKIQSIDPSLRQVTVVSAVGNPIPLAAGLSLNLKDFRPGDYVDAQYSRTVAWVITPSPSQEPRPMTETVGHVGDSGIGLGATQVWGRVIQIDRVHNTFDVVDASRGGVYTIVVTDPSRITMLSDVRVGTGVTVSVGPPILTSMRDCGILQC